jgi:hypothetical protein
MMEPMRLVGTEYVPEALVKYLRSPAAKYDTGRRIYWDDVPAALRASESFIRGSRYDEKDLEWNGCGRAFATQLASRELVHSKYLDRHDVLDRLFRPCPRVADDTGFCKSHKPSAIKDGRIR